VRSGWAVAVVGAVLLLGGCDADGEAQTSGVRVERVPIGPDPRVGAPFVGIGDRVLSVGPDGSSARAPEVMASASGGEWRAVRLPNAPESVLLAISRIDDRAVVVGRGIADSTDGGARGGGPVLVWTSRDGEHWTGGAVVASSTDEHLPTVQALGRDLVTSWDRDDRRIAIYRSRDGVAWQSGVIEGVAVNPGEHSVLSAAWREGGDAVVLVRFDGYPSQNSYDQTQFRSTDGGTTWAWEQCPLVGDAHCAGRIAAPGIIIRGDRSSVDDGRTWNRWRIRPEPAGVADGSASIGFASVDRVHPGVWLATADYARDAESGRTLLLRSTDGTTWRPARDLPSSCDYALLSPPLRVGVRWFMTSTCSSHGANPDARSHVVTGPLDATRFVRVPDTEVHAAGDDFTRMHPPLAVGDDVLVPVTGGPDGGYFLKLTP
jgi:hypothetical protein